MTMDLSNLPLFKDGRHDYEAAYLGQEPIMATLGHAIAQLPAPGCIALYGAWGTGKTSVLRQVMGREDQKDTRRTVWFDPWEYERLGDVMSSLLHAIITQLGLFDETKKRCKNLVMGAVKTTLSLAARVTTSFFLGGGLGDETFKSLATLKPEDFASHFETWKKFQDQVAKLKEDFREMIEAALEGKPEDARVVIFLDDLDRCLPDNVVALIEGVKLLLCGRESALAEAQDVATRAIFVFGLDRRIVGEAIRHRYPGSSAYTGENYLEKIFDLSMEIPPVSVELVQDFIRAEFADNTEVLDSLSEAFEHDPRRAPPESRSIPRGLALIAHVLSTPVLANPRVIKRSLNRLVLLLAEPSRLQRLRDMQSGVERRSLLLWIAGAERFRRFRLFFRESSLLEYMRGMRRILGGKDDGFFLSADIDMLTRMTGLAEYIEAFGFKEGDWTQRQRETSSGGLRTIRDIDDFLLAAGL